MSNTRLSTVPLVLAVALSSAAACSGSTSDTSPSGPSPGDVATAITEGALAPSAAELAAATVELSERIDRFCESPSESTLAAARAEWVTATGRAAAVELLPWGPFQDDGYRNSLDFWPARPDSVEAAIVEAPVPVSAEWVATQGVARRGLPALEWLLYDSGTGSPAEALGAFGEGDAGGRRCGYLVAAAAELAARAAALAEASDAFVEEVRAAGGAGSRFATALMAWSELVNALYGGLEGLSLREVGKPSGLATRSEPDLTLLSAPLSDASAARIAAALAVAEVAYVGADEGRAPGVSALVGPQSAALDAEVRAAFAEARAALDALPGPLGHAITDDPESVARLHDALEALRLLFAADVPNVLGIQLTLTDNDGD